MEPGLWAGPDLGKPPAFVHCNREAVFHAEFPRLAGARPVFVYFAYDTDLSAETELERYIRLVEEAGVADYSTLCDPLIPALCVVGRGYWRNAPGTPDWYFHPPTESFDEVIDLLCGITNTIPYLIESRGAPQLGRYLADERDTQIERIAVRLKDDVTR